ncbi:MAG: UvrD-helicase domain-containing protein [Bacteroidota bacterium]
MKRRSQHDTATGDLFAAPEPDLFAASDAGPVLADRDQRDQIRAALDDTLVVEAAAGTGKTTELVRRMVAVLEAGKAELDRMVGVTFTDAAAGELKLRLREEIERARLDSDRPPAARERLAAALPKLEEARIGTIHSFCADLLRERPVEARVDPRFEVAPEDAARPLFERVFQRWFEGQLANPSPGVTRILCRWKREPAFLYWGKDEGPRGLLRRAARSLIERRDFPAPWRHADGFDRDRAIDAIVEEMEQLAEWVRRGNERDYFVQSLIAIGRYVDEVRRMERVRARKRDYDALEAKITDWTKSSKEKHWGWKGWAKPDGADFPQKTLRERRDALKAEMDRFVREAGADLAPRLRDELWPIVNEYERAKEAAGCLDFEDLLLRARDLVRGNAGVRAELQRRFTHYFVDEFQDTDPLQAEVLMLLAADDPSETDWRRARPVPGKLFLVGDPKQSIYRFRRADVELYRAVQRQLVAQGARSVHLTVSFRSVPDIQDAVNAAFESPLGGPHGGDYVALEGFRESYDGQPPVVALPVPAPYTPWNKIANYRIDESLPDVVAAWIQWLVEESGWTVTEREKPHQRVPVEARHVCVLFRRFRSGPVDVTRPYVTALEARRLPHLLVGGSSFHEREEVEALRNALTAIERPDDEMSVFATLRGPLFALSDAALLTWKERVGGLHPFRRPPESGATEALREVADSLAVLRDLHRTRNLRPVADTISALLETTRAHAALAIWPTGMQALANVGRLMDLARRAEQQGLGSFRAFVDRLEEDAERGEAAEAPLLEEGIQGVRLMTVHKAKGLEFPIVILADMTAKETFEEPGRWSDPARGLFVQKLAGCSPPELIEHAAEEMQREREEAVRLVYVAATRARDTLVVPVIGDERFDGWLKVLNSVVYPDVSRSRRPEAKTAPGCPIFGDDSVPGRPEGMDPPMASVAPGLHSPSLGAHRVVWWDPALLTLNVRPELGLAQTEILKVDEESERSQTALADWEGWRWERDETLAEGRKPTRVVQAATEWVRAGDTRVEGADMIVIMESAAAGARPKGPRFGTLVHALLSVVDLGDATGVAGHATVQARLLGATDEERDAAARVVEAALAHPLLRRAATAASRGECRRETPLLLRIDDGTLLECVADLAFREDGRWTVVDFKTDAEIGAQAESYRRQIALYARGISEATGTEARGVLLRV